MKLTNQGARVAPQKKNMNWITKMAGALMLAQCLALAVTPVAPPTEEIPSVLKPNYVPKRLHDYLEKPIMLLLDLEKQRETWAARATAEPIKISTLKPNRVYLYYVPQDNRWHQVITDAYGKLKQNPVEALRASTVVPGTYVGAKSDSFHYVLLHNKLWQPTSRRERYEYWITASPPIAKYVEFEPLMKGNK